MLLLTRALACGTTALTYVDSTVGAKAVCVAFAELSVSHRWEDVIFGTASGTIQRMLRNNSP